MGDIKFGKFPCDKMSKLTQEQVKKIKLAFKNNPMLDIKDVAKQYNVSDSCIYEIKANRAWRNVHV